MNWPTFIVALIVAGVFVAIIAVRIRNKKKGKGGCSCGGSCESCGMCCSSQTEKKD